MTLPDTEHTKSMMIIEQREKKHTSVKLSCCCKMHYHENEHYSLKTKTLNNTRAIVGINL